MPKFSLIVLSKTDNDSIFKMNLDCFNSFIDSTKKEGIGYEIILVESNKKANYKYNIDHFQMLTPEGKFNFHKFLNIGISTAIGEYLILSNNDVLFDVNWLIEVCKVAKNNPGICSFSPYDTMANKLPKHQIENNNYIVGYQVQKHITGWCLILHKEVFKSIKKLDERFDFYYADNDYAMMLRKYNLKHALVTNAKVSHLESMSSKVPKMLQANKKINPKVPKYIIRENWTWVLENDKMIEGLITFHDKWGSRGIIKMKLKASNVLSKLGLGYFNRFILFNS